MSTSQIRGLPIRVLKFGSSILAERRDARSAVHEVYRELRAGRRVVVVVSAIGSETDRLDEQLRRYVRDPDPFALALHLATGEARSAALFASALERAGVRSEVLEPAAIGLVARGDPLDADLIDVDVQRVLATLERGAVLVVPGFFAPGRDGRTRLLGRGGSDLTALFLAARLPDASAVLLKDVDGIFDRDPAEDAASARHFGELTFVDALRWAGPVVQPKALRFALESAFPFRVASLDSMAGTHVGAAQTHHGRPEHARRALRVTLLGLGTVGLGVYRELALLPDLFEVRRILVRNARGRTATKVPRSLLTTIAARAVLDDCDVVVELLGGEEPARTLLREALPRGIDVVTANKPLVVEHGRALAQAAAASGARLAFSAAVGGALPVLETARALRARGIVGFEGVLNSTTNVVLDRIAAGATLEAAVAEAHARGFCEADPWVDLAGDDAAHKLELAARAAFGDEVALDWRERRGINDVDPEAARAARARGGAVRLVASCRLENGHAVASLAPRALTADDPLAHVANESNQVCFLLADGARITLAGRGAGRWPTTESVLGDLLELARARRARELEPAGGVA